MPSSGVASRAQARPVPRQCAPKPISAKVQKATRAEPDQPGRHPARHQHAGHRGLDRPEQPARHPVAAAGGGAGDDPHLELGEVARPLRHDQRILGAVPGDDELARAGLDGAAEQGRLQVPVAQHPRGFLEQSAVDDGEARPAALGVDPFVAIVGAHVGNGEDGMAAERGEPGHVAFGGDQAVAEQEQAVLRRHRLGRLGGAARDDDLEPLAAQPVDRGGELGRHPLDGDDDRRSARGRRQPRLPLDQGAAGERQSGAKAAARLVRFVIGGDQRGQRHEGAVPPVIGRL